MLMPKRYKEWSGSNCVTTVQNVWVTLSNDSLALEYDPNPPKWYVVSLDNKIFNAEFSKIDEYRQPLPEGEDSTITILKMLYAGDGACASITNGIEASTTYSARLNITDLNREGSVEVDVVQIEDGGAVERLLSSQTVTGTGLMDIDFTTETNDSVRVKIVLSEDMGDRDTAYVSLKLDKFSHPITLTHYYQALQPRLVTTCGEVKDLYRFGHNGQMKTNELAGIGNWYTALYWEYGTREAGRKNRDPKPSAGVSPYAVFDGNPILKSDINGDIAIWDNIAGAVIGGVVDYSFQVMENGMKNHRTFTLDFNDFKNVNWKQVGVSTIAGGLSSGASSMTLLRSGYKTAITTLAKNEVRNVVVNSSASAVNQFNRNINEDNQTFDQALHNIDASEAITDGVFAAAGAHLPNVISTKRLENEAKRMNNIANSGRTRESQTARAVTAERKLFKSGKANELIRSTESTAVTNAKNTEFSSENIDIKRSYQPAADNTGHAPIYQNKP